jgi:hypothetical protein
MTGTTVPPLMGGEEHRTHKVFLGGDQIDNDWKLAGRYHYSTQCRDEKYVAKIKKGVVDKRDSISEKKFNGTLDNGTENELDKDQFVRALKRRVSAHGHEAPRPNH